MSSPSSSSPISAALNSRSDAAKDLNGLIARQGPDFGFAKSRMMNGMNNEIKSALGDEYVSKKLHDLKTGYMMNVRDLFLQAHHVARIIKTSWNDDGKAKIYDIVEVVHQPTNERFIAEIDMYDELQKVINVPEDIKKDLPFTFVGNADDLRRLVSAVSGEQVEEIEESVLAKWLARNNENMNTKIFVGNLTWRTEADRLRSFFRQFGEILDAYVVYDKDLKRSKCYGFVKFKDAESAAKACEDPSPIIDGRKANCNLAYIGPKKNNNQTDQEEGPSQLQPIVTQYYISPYAPLYWCPYSSADQYHPMFCYYYYY